MQESCLINDMEHKYTFLSAEFGKAAWICELCGQWCYEFEDSQP